MQPVQHIRDTRQESDILLQLYKLRTKVRITIMISLITIVNPTLPDFSYKKNRFSHDRYNSTRFFFYNSFNLLHFDDKEKYFYKIKGIMPYTDVNSECIRTPVLKQPFESLN